MKCKVYPSVETLNQYIIAPSEVSVNELPKDAQDKIGQNKACKEIELSPERHQQEITNTKYKGYHIQEIIVSIKEIEGQAPPNK